MLGCPAAVAGKPGVQPAQGDRALKAFGAQDQVVSQPEGGRPQWQVAWGGQCPSGPGQRDTGLHDSTQLRHLRVLKELWTNLQVGTNSSKVRPKAEPRHVPLHKGARKGAGTQTLKIVQRLGRSLRQGGKPRVLGRAAQANSWVIGFA